MISLLNVSLREPNSSSNCSLRSEAMSFSRLWCSMAYLRTHDDTKITLVRLGYTRWKCYWCYCHLLSIASVVYVGVEACWKHHMPWDPWDIHKIYRAQSAVGHPIIPFQRKPLASCWSETIKDQNHHCKTSCPGQSLCILKHSLHLNWSIHEFQAGSYDCIRIDHIKIMSDHGMLYNWHRIRYHLHRQFLNIYLYIIQYFRYVSTIFTGPIWVWGLNGRPWPGSNLHDLQNCQTFPNVGVFSLSTCSAHFDGHRTNRTTEISHLKLVNFTRLSLFRSCLLSCSLTQGRR